MNPLLQRNKPTNNGNILQRFAEFKRSMNGKDPNKVLNDMIQSGQVSQAQLDKAVSQAKQLSNILK